MGKSVWELMGNFVSFFFFLYFTNIFSVILLKRLDYFHQKCWTKRFLLEPRSLRIN